MILLIPGPVFLSLVVLLRFYLCLFEKSLETKMFTARQTLTVLLVFFVAGNSFQCNSVDTNFKMASYVSWYLIQSVAVS